MAKNLALAMEIQRKNKRKSADSVPAEKRPMPETQANDAASIAHNGAKKALVEAGMMDAPMGDMKKPKIQAKPGPDMVKSNSFTARLRKPEDHLMEAMPPKKYADGGSVDDEAMDDASSMSDDINDDNMPDGEDAYAKGGMINKKVSMSAADDDMEEHPEGLESDDDQEAPPEDEYMASKFARGGEVSPDDEEMMEHHASIAAAIMAKKAAKQALDSGSMDEDDAEMYASGGVIEDPNEEEPNMYESRNKAALKENYDQDEIDNADQPEDSNEMGDSEEDDSENKNDRISMMRKRVMAKRR